MNQELLISKKVRYNNLEAEIKYLKETISQKECALLEIGRQIFEEETGWKFRETILTNKNGNVKMKVMLQRAELRNGEFTVIGEVMNKHGGFSGRNRIITPADYTEVKTNDTAI
ncbi:hypothetical protein [Kingella pumchi]|uniref:Uncharacterized protein n=1 Tax=Kingella pumchi TaxID=2779506 RepID=A0ABS9NPL0_9NEIS|nr:hypothetical protein [Kingella pumchi]MCG6504736.1 hypothetical protein [Kingella pumchi]